MNERLIHLRIKIKSLAAEAMIIRKESHKTSGMVKWGLNHHRTAVVRDHTRHNLLAYGLLKGIPYEVMEKKCDQKPNLKRVEEIAKRFGGTDEVILPWITRATLFLTERKQ